MNEVLKTIAERYSCREFTDRPPTDGQLAAIALAGAQSPSAVNGQPWRIIVVRDKNLLAEMDAEGMKVLKTSGDSATYERMMSRGGTLFYGATGAIIVASEAASRFAALDCGIAVENMALAAASLGLGNVICGMMAMAFAGDNARDFTERLGFPEGFGFGMSLLLGHAKQPAAPHAPDMSKISYVG